ncbi:hypothetical protein C2E23DRAFT_802002 [Lenzites betulinus]|nr:hypothetical protein C2E23DRAFT_802002 [Lenzites betulinus]
MRAPPGRVSCPARFSFSAPLPRPLLSSMVCSHVLTNRTPPLPCQCHMLRAGPPSSAAELSSVAFDSAGSLSRITPRRSPGPVQRPVRTPAPCSQTVRSNGSSASVHDLRAARVRGTE